MDAAAGARSSTVSGRRRSPSRSTGWTRRGERIGTTLECDVLVIGGGATGLGVVRDAAMRGFRAMLVERVDLGQGTTGRFHGLLHSGGRYVVSDPQSATECAEENAILKRIAAGGDRGHGRALRHDAGRRPRLRRPLPGRLRRGRRARQEIAPAEALAREPRVNPGISRAFEVQDAAVDAWKLLWGNAGSARAYGAQDPHLPLGHRDPARRRPGGRRDRARRPRRRRGAHRGRFTVNAGGIWAGQIADMADCPGVTVVPGKGIMIAMNHRLVSTVRQPLRARPATATSWCRSGPSASSARPTSAADTPDDLHIPRDEVQQMLDAGEVIVPGFRQARALHAWSGSRPLFKDERAGSEEGGGDTRTMSRGLALVNHLRRDGVSGFLTITGGQAHDLPADGEIVVDAMCEQLGEERPCRTAGGGAARLRGRPHLLARLAPGGARGRHGRGPARLRVRAAAAPRRWSRSPRSGRG